MRSVAALSRFGVTLLVALTMAGCGGGGGSGASGGGGSGGGSTSGGLTVNPTTVTLSTAAGSNAPVTQTIAVTVTNPSAVAVGAAYPPGTAPATWLNIQVSGTAPNYTFSFTGNPAGVTAGTYSTTVAIGITSSNDTVLDYRNVSVTFTVSPLLNVSAGNLAFSHAIGATAPAAQVVQITGNGPISWSASADQAWVTLGATSGTTPAVANVGINPAGLSPGNYSSTISWSAGGLTRQTTVALVVSAPAIQPGAQQLTYSGINGAGIGAQTLQLTLNNNAVASWTASTNAPWVQLSATSGNFPQTISVSVDPALGALASGSHTASVTIYSTYSGVSLSSTVNVSLNLTPATLTFSAPQIILGGPDGADTSPVAAQLSLNTSGTAWPWQVTGLPTGALSSAMSGSVSGTPVSLSFQPSTSIVGGTYTQTAQFRAFVNGDVITRDVPVTVRIKPHHLFVKETGIALTSTAGPSQLSRSVTVRENRGMPVAFTATSDQPWLTIGGGTGTTGGSFQLTANPAALPLEAVSYANVSVSSSDPTITGTEVIHVGLYRTAATPAAQITASVPVAFAPGGPKVTGIAADPVRPYVYVSHGTSVVDIYHVYTGALVRTMTASGSSDLRSLAVSDDGARLYALDHGTLSVRVADISAATQDFIANWTNSTWSACSGCNNPFQFADLDYTRINGRRVLIGGDSDIFDAQTGAQLVNPGVSFFALNLAGSVSGDGTVIFTAGLGTSGYTAARRTLAYDELNDSVSLGTALTASKSSASRGVTTDFSGSIVYHACWYQDQTLERFDGATLATLSSISSGTNGGALPGPGGYVYCARYYDDFLSAGWPDLWAVNSTTGATITGRTYSVPDTVMERIFIISGDGLRILARSQATSSPTAGTLSSTAIGP